eukprot:TRINITY_DN47878_c0_g1_i1.p1 TRINITY_DN47878_c0_g1~~TRINITY_DN47878_c0_g1_i1.p1  ORF type:complete len:147 (+),score=27.75 TRINITY_DN47878_c0_g1_i1:53-493(+)
MSAFLRWLFIVASVLTSSTAVAEDASAAAPGAREERRAKRREDSWLSSILGCPLCKGKEVLACYRPCRAQGGGMGECLTGCMTNNPMVLEMMLKLMPKEESETSGEKVEKNASENKVKSVPTSEDGADTLTRAAQDVRVQGHHSEL